MREITKFLTVKNKKTGKISDLRCQEKVIQAAEEIMNYFRQAISGDCIVEDPNDFETMQVTMTITPVNVRVAGVQ